MRAVWSFANDQEKPDSFPQNRLDRGYNRENKQKNYILQAMGYLDKKKAKLQKTINKMRPMGYCMRYWLCFYVHNF